MRKTWFKAKIKLFSKIKLSPLLRWLTFSRRVIMEEFLNVRTSFQIKFLTKAAKEFSSSLMAQVLVLVKARKTKHKIQIIF